MKLKDITDKFGITEKQLVSILAGKETKPKILEHNISNKVFTFGVVSDTHLCSIHEKLDELHTFYEICRKEKIEIVVHSGDLLCGWGIYRGQENEVKIFGADNQITYTVNNYPKVKGITTYFIDGNHDESWNKLAGIKTGEIIAKEREDMIYLGQYQGDLEINKEKIRLFHGGGNAYAISYKLQKMMEQIPSGDKPHILISGHYHTSLYFFYRLIHAFQAGCFEDQSLFLLRMGINPTIGGWTIKVRIADDRHHTVLSITPTFIPFMKGSKK